MTTVGGGGVLMDVYEELKMPKKKCQKNIGCGVWSGGGGRWLVGW